MRSKLGEVHAALCRVQLGYKAIAVDAHTRRRCVPGQRLCVGMERDGLPRRSAEQVDVQEQLQAHGCDEEDCGRPAARHALLLLLLLRLHLYIFVLCVVCGAARANSDAAPPALALTYGRTYVVNVVASCVHCYLYSVVQV